MKKQKPGKKREPPCIHLDGPTGELRKKSCKTKPSIPEHFCLQDSRKIELVRSSPGSFVPGKCTPEGKCHEFREGIPIQPCYLCTLYEPKS